MVPTGKFAPLKIYEYLRLRYDDLTETSNRLIYYRKRKKIVRQLVLEQNIHVLSNRTLNRAISKHTKPSNGTNPLLH